MKNSRALNTIELHTDGCIMNCAGCPSANANVSPMQKIIDVSVRESFLILQDKINELNINAGIQYNMPILSLDDLHLIIKKQLIDQIGFASQMPENKQDRGIVVDKFYAMHDSLNSNTLAIIFTQKAKILSEDTILGIVDFAKDFSFFAKEKGYKKIGINLMKNILNGFDNTPLDEEYGIIKIKLIDAFKELKLIDQNIDNEKDGPDELFGFEKYSFRFSDKFVDFGLAKRVMTLLSKGNKRLERETIKKWSIDKCKYISLNPQTHPIFHVAIYPKEIWINHDPFDNLGGQEYYTVTHEKFQEYVQKITITDLQNGAINFAYLLQKTNNERWGMI